MFKKIVIAILLLGSVLSYAFGASPVVNTPQYPIPCSKYVNDYISLLPLTDNEQLVKKLITCEQRLGIQCSVVIINRVDTFAKNMRVETFATNLFNRWGIGDRVKNNGVLLLVSLEDRCVRIELGAGYRNNNIASSVINTVMLPLFKQGKPQEAVIKGTEAIITALENKSATGWGWTPWVFLIALIGFFVAFIVYQIYLTTRPVSTTAHPADQNKKSSGRQSIYYIPRHTTSKPTITSFGGGRSSGGGFSGRW